MNKITQPLRLAVGSHEAGSGKGCAMNVVSWESGDTTITDLPDCADLLLAKVVQQANDDVCTHRDGDLLCPTCSAKVLALAHRTPGTRLPVEQAARVQVLTACVLAEEVLHLVPESHRTAEKAAIDTARRWVAGEATVEECYAAAYAAYAASAADPVAHAHHVIDVWHQQREALGYDLPGWEPVRTVMEAIVAMQEVTS